MLTSQYKALFLWLRLFTIVLGGADGGDVINYPPEGFEGRLLSPRLDHNGWKPLGHGDPLKNDPTFDYSPPALERVRYWAENNKSKEDVGKKNKTDILLLGVSSKRDNMKKEQKYTSVRRSYYGGHLPTRLMPPPMQTLQTQRVKSATTEMHHYPTHYPSTKSYYTTSSSGTYRTKSPYEFKHDESITYRTKSPYDSKHEESFKYVSFTRPDTKLSNIRSNPNDFVGMTSPRKPWVHELLQKELIKSKSSPPKNLPTTSMKNIYETHIPSTFITTTSTPIYTRPTTTTRAPTTTTTQKPMYPSYRPTFASEPIYPTVAPIEITTESIFKQPDGHFEVSMYQIIEGHSKVKTYGQNDNETSTHQPKIVPITPRQESVVRHVTSHDDSRFTHQVKHLHTKQSTTTTTTTTTTTPRPYIDTRLNEYPTIPTQPPAQQGASMQGLLSLLDSSLGNFFIDEPTGDDMGTLFSGPALDTEPTIFVTTTTSYPPTALELGSPRSARQIFDYDQLPESRLKDSLTSDFDDESSVLPKIWLRSSGTDIISEGENR